jgi:alginate O-acetyltransferase complex protein AlgI
VTMVLAGIWHGAGLQFVVFGALHGCYITVNHAWRTFGPKTSGPPEAAPLARRLAYGALVYLCVVVAQIFFHAPSVGSALATLSDMTGIHAMQAATPWPHAFFNFGQAPDDDAVPMIYMRDTIILLTAFCLAWLAPNTQQLMGYFEPALEVPERDRTSPVRVSFNPGWAFAMGLLLFFSLSSVSSGAPFIYFQF